jgi:hypothetical protein
MLFGVQFSTQLAPQRRGVIADLQFGISVKQTGQEARGLLFDGPWWREAAGGGHRRRNAFSPSTSRFPAVTTLLKGSLLAIFHPSQKLFVTLAKPAGT